MAEIEVISREANGGFISPQMTTGMLALVAEANTPPKPAPPKPTPVAGTKPSPTVVTTLKMAKSQWEKIVRLHAGIVDGVSDSSYSWCGVPVTIDRTVPESEVWFTTKDGTVLGKIVGLER